MPRSLIADENSGFDDHYGRPVAQATHHHDDPAWRGLGGSFDGIVLHQILQWHHMISDRVPPTTVENVKLDTLADGLFHAAT